MSLSCAKNLRKTDLKTNRRNSCDPATTVACGGRENPDYLYTQNMKQWGQREILKKCRKQWRRKGILSEFIGFKNSSI